MPDVFLQRWNQQYEWLKGRWRGEKLSICLRETNVGFWSGMWVLFDSGEQNMIPLSGEVVGSTLNTVISVVCTSGTLDVIRQWANLQYRSRDFIKLSTNSQSALKKKVILCHKQRFLSPAKQVFCQTGNNQKTSTVISLTELSKHLAYHASYTPSK